MANPKETHHRWNNIKKLGAAAIVAGLFLGVPQAVIYGSAAMVGGHLLH